MINVYYWALLIVFIIAHIGVNGKYKAPVISWISITVILIILVGIAGFRSPYSIGDTPFYAHSYRLLAENPVIEEGTKDAGFVLLMILLTRITGDPQILIFITALITNIFIILTLYRYAKPFQFGIFLYFGTLMYYVSMNGIRQSLVAAILFWSVRYIIRGNWAWYFMIVLLLSAFHESALIFIPLYFLVRRKAWNRTFWMTIAMALVAVAAFKPMLGGIAGLLENTSYSNYGQDMLNNTASVNIIRVFVTAIPLVLAYIVRDKLEETWPEGNIFIYMSLLNFIFMLLGTQYLYFYRVCIYFDLFNLILVPRVLACFSREKRAPLYVYIIIFYTVFSWYQVNGWNDYYRNVLFT